MKQPEGVFDIHGYPTEAALEYIEKFDTIKEPVSDLVDFVCNMWWNGEWGVKISDDRWTIELHTGGWSGNESIIEAMSRNFLFWSQCWRRSECGGHYLFEIPEHLRKGSATPPKP